MTRWKATEERRKDAERSELAGAKSRLDVVTRPIVVRVIVHSLNTCADTRGAARIGARKVNAKHTCGHDNRETVFTHESPSFQSDFATGTLHRCDDARTCPFSSEVSWDKYVIKMAK